MGIIRYEQQLTRRPALDREGHYGQFQPVCLLFCIVYGLQSGCINDPSESQSPCFGRIQSMLSYLPFIHFCGIPRRQEGQVFRQETKADAKWLSPGHLVSHRQSHNKNVSPMTWGSGLMPSDWCFSKDDLWRLPAYPGAGGSAAKVSCPAKWLACTHCLGIDKNCNVAGVRSVFKIRIKPDLSLNLLSGLYFTSFFLWLTALRPSGLQCWLLFKLAT